MRWKGYVNETALKSGLAKTSGFSLQKPEDVDLVIFIQKIVISEERSLSFRMKIAQSMSYGYLKAKQKGLTIFD